MFVWAPHQVISHATKLSMALDNDLAGVVFGIDAQSPTNAGFGVNRDDLERAIQSTPELARAIAKGEV